MYYVEVVDIDLNSFLFMWASNFSVPFDKYTSFNPMDTFDNFVKYQMDGYVHSCILLYSSTWVFFL